MEPEKGRLCERFSARRRPVVRSATVRFARYPGESAKIIFAPVFIALERGYFRDEGLNVEIVEPSDHPWQSVASGESDAGVAYIDFCARPEYRDRFKAVAVQERLTKGRGLPALLARPPLIDDGSLREESGLRGRVLGLTWGRGDDYLTYAFVLRRGGLALRDVRYVAVPHEGEERRNMLARGEIDVIINRRPRAVADEEARGVLRRWKVGGEIENPWQNRFIIFSTAFMQHSPAAGRAFLRAHQRGVAAYVEGTMNGSPDAAFLPELSRLSSETAELLTGSRPAGFPIDSQIHMASLSRDVQLLKEVELFPREIDVEAVIDQTFSPHESFAGTKIASD